MASRDKIIAKAEKLVAKGKTEDAIRSYEKLLDDNPNDVNTLNRIGDLWVRIQLRDLLVGDQRVAGISLLQIVVGESLLSARSSCAAENSSTFG